MLARAKRDYYAVLGVPPDADREEIKRAFRSLAGQWHPDVSPDPDAAAHFQQIAEAYEVLSRPESRARYDRVHAARRSAGVHRRRGAVRVDVTTPGVPGTRPGERGADVALELHLAYREAARGTVRSVRYEVVDACPRCLGTGRDGARGCLSCGATGLVDVARTATVRIAPATPDGAELRVPSEGSPGGRGAGPGDLVVAVRVRSLPDSPLVRRLAVVGVACALGLGALVTLLQ